MNSVAISAPPDVDARNIALDPHRSVLVQAPAGSGKTDLLTRRFLRLLCEVDDPGKIVAITFTIAAAAEMRQRILSKLEKADATDASQFSDDPTSPEALAHRALEHSRRMNWQLLDLSSRLRISTIDSFCREVALRQPLLSEAGGSLEIHEQPDDLYLRAARLTLERLGDPADSALDDALQALLLWRDNNWREMEVLLVEMLRQRDRWMQDFVFVSAQDWEKLRRRLERPFAVAVANALSRLSDLLRRNLAACDEALELARFASAHMKDSDLTDLAEIAELPCGPFVPNDDALDSAHEAYVSLTRFLLTQDGKFREKVNAGGGFPAGRRTEKERFEALSQALRSIPGLAEALDGIRRLPRCRYTEDEWRIVRASFTVLRHASGELKTIIAEQGRMDFAEVAQLAQNVLQGEDGLPTDAAIAVADDIHHLLVDEFQDTSRSQYKLLSSLVSAWPDLTGRTVFVVGDPMQSIYFFRDAEVELFQRIRTLGLESGESEYLPFTPADLTANFRTAPELIGELNAFFTAITELDDQSGITFRRAQPMRLRTASSEPHLRLHLDFVPRVRNGAARSSQALEEKQEATARRSAAHAAQTAEVVDLIRAHADRIKEAQAAGRKYRVAVLGRTRNVLAPIAEALREAEIHFRAIDLEVLSDRPEILDALALARALVNHQDRVSWLGVLRAPWCGLSLEELHAVAGTDDWSFPPAPVPKLLEEKRHLLGDRARIAIDRLLNAVHSLSHLRSLLPTASLGTQLRQVWMALGGESCADATARANLDLFWKLLDQLPNGEQDLCGVALDTALKRLYAQPDPASNSDAGVQLMTIHQSKGLEFEVVIVPDLQAGTRGASKKLLSWLERGLTEAGESGEVTEFLVAPVQPKGRERGKAKEWVDGVYTERESQEMRRILYVAATRAREELHLFAQPEYKQSMDESLELVKPSKSLLATAWPAVAERVAERFEEWKRSISSRAEEAIVSEIAASADTNVVVMPRPSVSTFVRHLPDDFEIDSSIIPSVLGEPFAIGGSSKPYRRHEGGPLSRVLGTAVHRLLEELARLRASREWEDALAVLPSIEPQILAQIRAAGIPPAKAASIATQAMKFAQASANDPIGRWILSPRAEAESEAGWAGIVSGGLHQVRVDRVFRAGPAPLSAGNDTWWVIDFKTAHSESVDPASALPVFRAAFAPQLEMYSALLRNLHGRQAPLRAGLYYPRMSLLDWWTVE